MPTVDIAISVARSRLQQRIARRASSGAHGARRWRHSQGQQLHLSDGCSCAKVRKWLRIPRVEVEEISSTAMALPSRDPSRFDVIVATNFHADILSDWTASSPAASAWPARSRRRRPGGGPGPAAGPRHPWADKATRFLDPVSLDAAQVAGRPSPGRTIAAHGLNRKAIDGLLNPASGRRISGAVGMSFHDCVVEEIRRASGRPRLRRRCGWIFLRIAFADLPIRTSLLCRSLAKLSFGRLFRGAGVRTAKIAVRMGRPRLPGPAGLKRGLDAAVDRLDSKNRFAVAGLAQVQRRTRRASPAALRAGRATDMSRTVDEPSAIEHCAVIDQPPQSVIRWGDSEKGLPEKRRSIVNDPFAGTDEQATASDLAIQHPDLCSRIR